MKIKLYDARLSFPALFVPDSIDGGEARYGCRLILPPKSKSIKLLEKTILEVATEKWGKTAEAKLKSLYAKDKVCLKKEPYAKADGTIYDGFEGMYYVNASSVKRPDVRNLDKTPLTAADGVVYAGCRVTGIVDIWAQENNFGQRVNAMLLGIQFVKDDEHFAGGATLTDDDFDDLSMDGDEDGEEEDDADDLA